MVLSKDMITTNKGGSHPSTPHPHCPTFVPSKLSLAERARRSASKATAAAAHAPPTSVALMAILAARLSPLLLSGGAGGADVVPVPPVTEPTDVLDPGTAAPWTDNWQSEEDIEACACGHMQAGRSHGVGSLEHSLGLTAVLMTFSTKTLGDTYWRRE
jgi:hypothetical protein